MALLSAVFYVIGVFIMKRYQQFLLHSTAWVMAEILLGLLGLDQLADYSEFLQTRTQLANKQPPIVIVL